AARTNGSQSAIDEVQRARLFTDSHWTVPSSIAKGRTIAFDGSRIVFFGHSQGGHTASLYLAADDGARGGVLSGSGAVLSISLLEKTEPAPPIAMLVEELLLGLDPPEFDEVSPLHPAISLIQTMIDPTDPIHYARSLAREPRLGWAPKSIYQTEGVE